MATIGRWTVALLSAMAFTGAQGLLRYFFGDWALWAYESVAFLAFCWFLDRVIFHDSRAVKEGRAG